MVITPRRAGALLAGGITALVLLAGIVASSPIWIAIGVLLLLACGGLLAAVLYRHLLRIMRAVDHVGQVVHGLQTRQPTMDRMMDMLKVSGQHAVDAQTLALRAYQELSASMEGSRHELSQFKERLGALHEEVASVGLTVGAVDERVKAVAAVAGDADKLDRWLKHHFEWLKYETVQEYEALTQLRSMLDAYDPAPLLGGWAMDPTTIYALAGIIRAKQPKLIVECGSGASTVWLARALRLNKSGRLVSLEHSEEFAEMVSNQLRLEGLEQYAEVRLAPLEPCKHADEDAPWYRLTTMADIQGIDLLIVDGPPGRVAPLARYPALPVLARAMAASALVVVDDAGREAESKTMRRWQKEFPELGERSTLAKRTVAFAWNARGEGQSE